MTLRTVENTYVEMTQVVLPVFTNAIGTVFGGQIVSWIDICGAVSAGRHARAPVVTASIDSVHFIAPVKQGQIVILKSQVNAVFKTSLEVGVVVLAENPLTGERYKACRAYCTFVALAENGKPMRLPLIEIKSEKDKIRAMEALTRRQMRLSARKDFKPAHESR
ncbi:MAG: acyl-CoA thioesterase [Myxococcaceae bacterium]|nr:acyl-CoA thioesterase [Myxococcaceae bacterium]MBH2005842.1 acyl-CoA thioesterase [Myxococcaceae bacterium]